MKTEGGKIAAKCLPRRGAVLLLVLGAVAILTVLAVELAHRASVDTGRSSRSSRAASFRRAFDSGLEIARGLLLEKRKEPGFDYWGDGWNSIVRAELESEIQVVVRVADESGKLNLVKAMGTGEGTVRARKMLARIFEYLRRHEPERTKQWEQVETSVRKRIGWEEAEQKVDEIRGAQAGRMPALRPAPLYTLEGLREAGVPMEVIFGKRSLDFGKGNVGGERPGWPRSDGCALCDLVTTFGDGAVNLNTAPEGVLYALDEEFTEEVARNIAGWRGGSPETAEAAAFRPFRHVTDLELVEGIVKRASIDGRPTITKNLLQKVQARVTVLGRCFSAHLEAQVDGRTRQAWGFFEATPGGPETTVKLVAYEEIEP